MPKTAALVVHYGRTTDDLLECCSRLAECHHIKQIIVVDNASPCPAPPLDWVTLVRAIRNDGLAAGTRAGLAHLEDDVEAVLLLNPDIRVSSAALEELLSALAAEGVGIVGPRLVDADGRDQYAARSIPSLMVILSRRSGFGRTMIGRRLVSEHLAPSVEGQSDPGWLLGACLLLRRSVGDELHWMDDHFFLYFEDVDLCIRARAAGYRVVYHPRAVVRHEYQRASHGRWALNQAQRRHLVSAAKFFRRYPRLIFPSLAAARVR